MSIIDRKRNNNNSGGSSTNSSKPKSHEEIAKEFSANGASSNGKDIKTIMEFAKEFVPNILPKTVKNKISGLTNSESKNSMSQPNVTIEEIAKEFFNDPSYKSNTSSSSGESNKNTNGLTEFANEFLSANTNANQNSTKTKASGSGKNAQMNALNLNRF